QCSAPKQNARTASLTITEITDTSVYRIIFLPSGDRARSRSAAGERDIHPIVPTAKCRHETTVTVVLCRHFVGFGHAAQPGRAWFGSALERGAVDSDKAEMRHVAKRPFEVVEPAPVHVAPHVDAVRE